MRLQHPLKRRRHGPRHTAPNYGDLPSFVLSFVETETARKLLPVWASSIGVASYEALVHVYPLDFQQFIMVARCNSADHYIFAL